jgi:hypothetical protein
LTLLPAVLLLPTCSAPASLSRGKLSLPKPTLTPAMPATGAPVQVTGRVPTKARRPVVLGLVVELDAIPLVPVARVATGTTDRNGGYAFRITAPASAGDYWYVVTARKLRTGPGKSGPLPAWTSRIRAVTVTATNPPPGARNDWATVTAAYAHACGLKTDSTAWCWGGGALGNGAIWAARSARPVQVAG